MEFISQEISPVRSQIPITRLYTKEIDFVNKTNRIITVNYPNGEFVSISPLKETVPSKEFIVYVTYSIHKSVTIDGIIDIIGKELYLQFKEELENHGRITMSYVVTDFEPFNNRKGIYIDSLAMALTDGLNVYNYPNNRNRNNYTNEDLKIILRASDSKSDSDLLYVKIGNSVFELQNNRCSEFKGVIINVLIGNEDVPMRIDDESPTNPFKIFETRKAAKEYEGINGSKEHLSVIKDKLAIKKIEEEHKFNTLQKESEVEYRKSLDDMSLIKENYMLQTKLSELSAKQELAEKKTNYEIRSLERKDSSEIIKWVPAILAGAAAIFGLLS